jgi:hypothetical protein
MRLLFELTLRWSLILSAGLLLDTVLRHRAAALRHCVLAGAIVAAAAVVPLSVVVPAWVISLPAKAAVAAPARPSAASISEVIVAPALRAGQSSAAALSGSV